MSGVDNLLQAKRLDIDFNSIRDLSIKSGYPKLIEYLSSRLNLSALTRVIQILREQNEWLPTLKAMEGYGYPIITQDSQGRYIIAMKITSPQNVNNLGNITSQVSADLTRLVPQGTPIEVDRQNNLVRIYPSTSESLARFITQLTARSYHDTYKNDHLFPDRFTFPGTEVYQSSGVVEGVESRVLQDIRNSQVEDLPLVASQFNTDNILNNQKVRRDVIKAILEGKNTSHSINLNRDELNILESTLNQGTNISFNSNVPEYNVKVEGSGAYPLNNFIRSTIPPNAVSPYTGNLIRASDIRYTAYIFNVLSRMQNTHRIDTSPVSSLTVPTRTLNRTNNPLSVTSVYEDPIRALNTPGNLASLTYTQDPSRTLNRTNNPLSVTSVYEDPIRDELTRELTLFRTMFPNTRTEDITLDQYQQFRNQLRSVPQSTRYTLAFPGNRSPVLPSTYLGLTPQYNYTLDTDTDALYNLMP